jgi:hypothetical protein
MNRESNKDDKSIYISTRCVVGIREIFFKVSDILPSKGWDSSKLALY